MPNFAITSQYPVFTDTDGTPLENGYIYIGTANKNPITNPISVYWDKSLDTAATQPIRTLNGAPDWNGSNAPLYCSSAFSILVRDKDENKIYYNPDGISNYTDSSFGDFTQYAPNGLFEVANTDLTARKVDRWFKDESSYSLTMTRTDTSFELLPLTNSSYYMNMSFFGLAFPAASDYTRFCCVVEDITKLAGDKITLSWYDRTTTENYNYSVSLTQKMPSGSPYSDVTGIGVTKYSATYATATNDNATRKTLTVDFPALENLTKIDLLINFWLSAGSDYDDQTDSLGNYEGVTNQHILGLFNIRLNKGAVIIDDNDKTFREELSDSQRYYEKSTDYFESGDHYITYVAGAASTTVPGFRFRTEKRTTSPTVTAYSYDSGTADRIYRAGVGDITVSSYNDVTSSGVGSMTLATPTVAGSVYQFYWIADDEFTI
jgi:hypothetical protein